MKIYELPDSIIDFDPLLMSDGLTIFSDAVAIRIKNVFLVVDEYGIKTNGNIGAYQNNITGPIVHTEE